VRCKKCGHEFAPRGGKRRRAKKTPREAEQLPEWGAAAPRVKHRTPRSSFWSSAGGLAMFVWLLLIIPSMGFVITMAVVNANRDTHMADAGPTGADPDTPLERIGPFREDRVSSALVGLMIEHCEDGVHVNWREQAVPVELWSRVRHIDNLHLDLAGTRARITACYYLSFLPQLISLNLENCPVNDVAIRLLTQQRLPRQGLPMLKQLNLSGTAITGKSIEAIIRLPLEYLELRNTKLTSPDLQRLRGAMPDCRIVRYDEPPEPE